MARRVKAARLGGAHEGHFERSRGLHGGIVRWPLIIDVHRRRLGRIILHIETKEIR